MPRRLLLSLLSTLLALGAMASTSGAQELALDDGVESGDVAVLRLPAVDLVTERLDDERRLTVGRVSHFAAAREVDVDPWRHGRWASEKRGLARWRLRLESPGALSLSLAFGRFRLPVGARFVVATDGGRSLGPFTSDDVDAHGQLWTPPVEADALTLELTVPVARLDDVELALTRVHHGYAGFGEAPSAKAGPCHRDLACADDEWRDAGRAVGLLTVEGVRYCTGFLVNNTAQDQRPLLLTARHCGIDERNAASVVVMWSFQRSACGDGQLPRPSRSFQTGAVVRATHAATDVVLLELDDAPPAGVAWAGWDRSEDDPRSSTAIHHPNTGAKRLALDADPARTTAHLGDDEVAGGDHLRVGDWEEGSTEGGSSGAPLFNEDRRAVGWLRGGHAACGVARADWFGRLSAAWHGISPRHRLRDWLDPVDSQALVLDALVPPAPTDRAP